MCNMAVSIIIIIISRGDKFYTHKRNKYTEKSENDIIGFMYIVCKNIQ